MSIGKFSKAAEKANENIESLDITGSAQNAMSRFQQVCKDLAKEPVAKQAAVGGASGWVVGYLSMKVGKVAATVVGGGLILVQLASHQGYIQIDWKRVNRDLEKNAKKLQKEVESQVTGKKGQSDSRARLNRRVTEMLEREVENVSDRSQCWFGGAQQWLKRQYRRQVLSKDERALQVLYAINVYLGSFWAGSLLGVATGRVF